MHLLSTSIVTSIVGFIGVMLWRVREGRSPVTLRKIVIPPLGMATGFSMFVVPAFRIPLYWGALAFLIGAIFLAYPLLLTSNLVKEGEAIMMRRSNAFFIVIIVLFAIRFLARSYLDSIISIQQSAALFFVLAFGMIVHWRMRMLLQYRSLCSQTA
jgi:membrane protein CcdC involved in cytochrome C biogenesis